MRYVMGKVVGTIAVLLLIFSGCSLKSPSFNEDVDPVLTDLICSDTLYTDTETYRVSVRITDPQGVNNILLVQLEVYSDGQPPQIYRDTLRDDGVEGDIIPKDGIFVGVLDVAGWIEGDYDMILTAADCNGNASTPLETIIHVRLGQENLAPSLDEPVVPDTLKPSSMTDVFFSIRVTDPQGLDDVDSVAFGIFPPYQPVPSTGGLLSDDGLNGDILAHDGLFSLRRNLLDALVTTGNHLIRFQAVDKKGLKSTAVVAGFFVDRMNGPPILSNITAPDTLSRSEAQPFLISVQVADPQSLADIRSVYFNTTKPDGTPSAGNPFFMYDDGSRGDITIGDGIYSLTITISEQNETGNYVFAFYAEDYSAGIGGPVNHTITVIE